MFRPEDRSNILPQYRLDIDFYSTVRAAKDRYKLTGKHLIPPRSGRGFIVPRGHTIRIVEAEGPQVADVAFWNAHDKAEHLSLPRTALMEGMFIGLFSRLWSDVPWFRPMAVCVEETVDSKGRDGDYHHHFIAGHCTPELMEARTGETGLNACHLNLLQAIEPFGLTEMDIHENINVHQKARIDPVLGKTRHARTTAVAGDYIEFFATIDLLVAVSVCPNGDNTAWQHPDCKPIGIETYDSGFEAPEFPKWTDWRKTWTGQWVPRPAAHRS